MLRPPRAPRASRFTLPGRPFSRSYGANLPSSLTEGLPSTLVCSTSPPVSVCGTVSMTPRLEAFLGCTGSIRAAWAVARAFPSPLGQRANGFAYPHSLPAWRVCTPGPTSQRPPIAQTASHWDRISNLLSITYAFRPRLRPASPAVDQHGCGTLGHPVGGILTLLALLMPTFALPAAPRRFPPSLHC